jgi:hypothetical protein
MAARLKDIVKEMWKNRPFTSSNPYHSYSLRDSWWLANVTTGKKKLSYPVPTNIHAQGKDMTSIMGFGHLDAGEAIALKMDDGVYGIFRVHDSKYFRDYDSAMYDAHVETMGVSLKAPAQAPH